MSESAVDRARAYYRALDEHDYDALTKLLAPAFVHVRPDVTLDGRDRFVRFMREERPQRDTTHRIEEIYRVDEREAVAERLAVRGRLLSAEGDLIVGFVDVFRFEEDRVARIDTYSQQDR